MSGPYDFVFDTCGNGQALKCLVIIDEWTLAALAIDLQGSLRTRHVIDLLSRLVSEQGVPHCLPRTMDASQPCGAEMAVAGGHRNGAYRPRQALAEWHCRELERRVP